MFDEISTAESGTVQLEFRDLGRTANEPKYEVTMVVHVSMPAWNRDSGVSVRRALVALTNQSLWWFPDLPSLTHFMLSLTSS